MTSNNLFNFSPLNVDESSSSPIEPVSRLPPITPTNEHPNERKSSDITESSDIDSMLTTKDCCCCKCYLCVCGTRYCFCPCRFCTDTDKKNRCLRSCGISTIVVFGLLVIATSIYLAIYFTRK